MAERCDAELCANWTGDGCACAVLGIEPVCGPCETDTHQHCERGDGDVCCCTEPVWGPVSS